MNLAEFWSCPTLPCSHKWPEKSTHQGQNSNHFFSFLFIRIGHATRVLEDIVPWVKIYHWSRIPDESVPLCHLNWLQGRCSSFVLVKCLCWRRSRRVSVACFTQSVHPHYQTLHWYTCTTLQQNIACCACTALFWYSPDIQHLNLSDPGNVTASVGDFILTWVLMSFLMYPGERGAYQASLMRAVIEEHLYHSLGQKCQCFNIIS